MNRGGSRSVSRSLDAFGDAAGRGARRAAFPSADCRCRLPPYEPATLRAWC